jgi:Signal transduction histidine kinase
VDRVVGSIKSLTHESRVRLEQVIDTPEWLLGDEDRLQQVLTNLLSNAIKWSPEDSVVRVVVTDSDGRVRFEIQDKGPGIPEEEVDKLFGRFQQVSTREERSRGGTGLGLAIAKAIVEQHGGAIGVFVKDGTEGSNFWFEVPIAEATVKSGTFKARAAKFAFHDTGGVKVSGQNEKVSTQSTHADDSDDSDSSNMLKIPAEKDAVEISVAPENASEANGEDKTGSNGKTSKKSSKKKLKR